MPKRSASEKIKRYNRKIRKLEEKEKQDRYRLERALSSSDNENISDAENARDDEPTSNGSAQCTEPVNGAENAEPVDGTQIPGKSTEANADLSSQNELDSEILLALGEPAESTPKLGAPIHENLAQRWQPILKKGIPKEVKEKLVKDYIIPENCPLLQAPRLNPEISAAITEMARNRDKKMETSQQQLGLGITAVSRAISTLIKLTAIKMLSDGCRILSDLHFLDTQVRLKMVTPGLDKSFLNIIKDTDRDDTLFGSKLSEKIKASRVIEKQGLQIKKPVTTQKTSIPTVQSTVPRPRYQENWTGRSRYQENWAGPSRYPPMTNRGGARGGHKKTAPAARKAPPTALPRSAGQYKFRGPPQQ